MDDNFILRGGKHSGKSVGWIKDNDISWLNWATANAPNLFKVKKEPKIDKKKVKFRDKPPQAITPNENFYNEGPADISIPYLERMAKEKGEGFDYGF